MDDTTDKYCNYKTTDCSVNTKDLYKGLNLPKRFECPYAFSGYGIQRDSQCVMYRTTSSDYGYYTPAPHTVPSRYFPLNQQFSSHLAATGMYRNYSLNTSYERPFCNQF
ncbi:piercer of microtubule wall 2 protein [Chironomus tepperi]|uniref:piercer of microtubule wall 2 protein n=1 Tax=Chironomus tepperi TaxID=113505 RepID=UPI00391EF805